MHTLMAPVRWTWQRLKNLRELIRGDALEDAQGHRSDDWGADRSVNPGYGGGLTGGGGGI